MGLYKKRANSYILFVKYQTIKYHTLSISAYEQRERQYPRKQLLPAAGQTICRLYGIRQKIRVNHQRAVYSGYHLFRSKRLHAGWDLRTPLRHEANRQRRHQKILEAGVRFTAAGKEYVERIIPPAAQAENDAMAELSGEQQAELVRLTDLFSEQMRLKFQSINKNTL